MRKLLLILLLPVLICCRTEIKEKIIIENDLTSQHLKGKVKEYSYDVFEVESYKFGEPQFELISSVNIVYNPFGFREKYNYVYNSKYSTSISEESIEYSDSLNGIHSKRTYKSDYSDIVNFFQYDSISKKLTEVKTIDSKDNTTKIRTYEYEKGIERISYYDESNELEELSVKKFDDKGRVLEEVDYDLSLIHI